ncbi:MAG: metal-sensitive transcriptional regulator [Chloroflexia bacterium]
MKRHHQELVARLKSIEGHVAGIRRMVEEDRYCVDIMRQVQAVQQALEQVNALLLSGHLEICVTEAVRGDDPEVRSRVLGELMELFQAARGIRRGGRHGEA